MLASGRNRYKDIYLKDMYETDNKGMTSTQQNKIKTLANTILTNTYYKCPEDESENVCKLRKFHDWIKLHFYYYNPVTQTNAGKLGLSLDEYDNPYYVLTKNNLGTTNKYISRCNGYTSLLIALARNEGIPALAISGYYNTSFRTKVGKDWVVTEYDEESEEEIITKTNPEENTLSHAWVAAYVDSKWIFIDANADSYNTYSTTKKCAFNSDGVMVPGSYLPSSYTDEESCTDAGYSWTNWTLSQKSFSEQYDNKYFNIDFDELSDSHIMFKYRAGSLDAKYITNTSEATKLKAFLNRKTSGITNGKRINSSYNTSTPGTWFTKGDTKSLGDGYGRLYKLYWPTYKKLWGRLTLSGFTSLQNVSVPHNRLTSLYMENCPSLTTVAVANNNLTKIIVTGSKKLSLLSAQGNPTTYVKYNFGTQPRTAIIEATKGGTVSVKYSKSGTKHNHTMSAFAKSGYKFKGWYKGTKLISSKYSITITNTTSFTYTAKFVKR